MAKKILITGFNKEQCTRDYFLTKELRILNSHYSLIRCLEDMGFIVEQRPVNIGEDLSEYDRVIVYLHSIQSFCQFLYDGLYAIKARPDAILAFDDWQIDQVMACFPQFKRNLLDEEKYNPFRQYLLDLYYGSSDEATIREHKQDYLEAIEQVLSYENKLMICAYAGGDLNKFKLGWSKDKMFSFNPNPYNLNRGPHNNYGEESSGLDAFFDDEPTKARAWVFSSLNHKKNDAVVKKNNFTWDIAMYGPRRGEYKAQRLKEPEMCREYAKHWGCLLPKYYHAGSGWWRSRVQQVADAGSILLCDDIEGKIYGDAYVGLNISDIENMDNSQLEKLAKYQYECLYDNHPLDKKVQRDELNNILEI